MTTLVRQNPFEFEEAVEERLRRIEDAVRGGALGVSVETGVLFPFVGVVAPDGYLICQGQLILISAYPALDKLVGAGPATIAAGRFAFSGGSDPGGGQFRLPDLKGRMPIGLGIGDARGATVKALGVKYGEETHQLKTAEAAQKAVTTGNDAPDHVHASAAPPSSAFVYQASNVATNIYVVQIANTNTGGASVRHQHSVSGSDAASDHNTLGPALGLNYIIKT